MRVRVALLDIERVALAVGGRLWDRDFNFVRFLLVAILGVFGPTYQCFLKVVFQSLECFYWVGSRAAETSTPDGAKSKTSHTTSFSGKPQRQTSTPISQDLNTVEMAPKDQKKGIVSFLTQ
jgi:hypothetical protein